MEKTRHYGVPYKGSKNKIVKRLMERVPSAIHFYDLFCGGCAVTHRAIEAQRFTHYHANDLDGSGLRLFIDAANGKFRNERRWISREQFFAEKDTDPYISLCWIFGNNQHDYMYGCEVEPYKRAGHEAVMHGDFSLLEKLFPGLTANLTPPMSKISDLAERHFFFALFFDNWRERQVQFGGGDCSVPDVDYHNNESVFFLKRLQHIERIAQLAMIESTSRNLRLKDITFEQAIDATYTDYRNVEIADGSVVYCDIPYRGVQCYNRQKKTVMPDAFYDDFYSWCRRQKQLVIISEYAMPDDFVCVAEFAHRCTFSSMANNAVTERLFVPQHQAQLYRDMMNQGTLFSGF